MKWSPAGRALASGEKYSGQWHAEHLSQPLDSSALASLEAEAQASIERQRELEAEDEEPFEVPGKVLCSVLLASASVILRQ